MVDEWKPTVQQTAFVADVIATDYENISESYRKAYPDSHSKWAGVDAYRLLKNKHIKALIEQIQQDIRAKFVLIAPEALERLKYLADNADSEKVMLEANKEILDRGGFKPPEKVELSNLGIFGSADPEDIKRMIRDRQNEKEQVKEAQI